jgi:hypothetical protein
MSKYCSGQGDTDFTNMAKQQGNKTDTKPICNPLYIICSNKKTQEIHKINSQWSQLYATNQLNEMMHLLRNMGTYETMLTEIIFFIQKI